ncbi:uncharacterized protein LOC134456605 [Engraulis encrasicolus]|uniref:uncharacterized protein LOC134456605 n=1 Tax=Engraulis encrasicolus TaxID=184585 RepID=UPI002FD67917
MEGSATTGAETSGYQFYENVKTFLQTGRMLPLWGKQERWKVRRSSKRFIVKDRRLFYIGPRRQYMRLVITSDAEKDAVLNECHNLPGSGNHRKFRGTRNKAISGYFWDGQAKDIENWLNEKIFEMLRIKHSVSSAYHPQTNGQDERTNQNIKRALRKYVNDAHDDWDLHLDAVIYGINTTLQASTRHTPFFLMYHRHPLLPEVLNACPLAEFEMGKPDDEVDDVVNKMKAVNEKVLQNIERAQQRQMKGFATRKGKKLPVRPIGVGDEVLVVNNPLNKSLKEGLSARHRGPYTVVGLTAKGVATLKYVLDTSRPGNELLTKEGDVCLLREDFLSLGLNRCMDSTVKDVHIVDMFAVPTWKMDVDPLSNLPVSVFAEVCVCFCMGFPQQTGGVNCGIFMLMYALSFCTSTPFNFSEVNYFVLLIMLFHILLNCAG